MLLAAMLPMLRSNMQPSRTVVVQENLKTYHMVVLKKDALD
jgi:hypothetical protein